MALRRARTKKSTRRSSGPTIRPIVRLLWRFHRWLYAVSRGRLGGRVVGMPVLLLTTTGRRSGHPHRVGLTYLRYGDAYALIGSNAGASNHPDWVLNLRAHPRAAVQIGGRTAAVQAREAVGEERTELWRRAVAGYARYAAYQRRTDRRIPVVVLDPRKGDVTEPSSRLHAAD